MGGRNPQTNPPTRGELMGGWFGSRFGAWDIPWSPKQEPAESLNHQIRISPIRIGRQKAGAKTSESNTSEAFVVSMAVLETRSPLGVFLHFQASVETSCSGRLSWCLVKAAVPMASQTKIWRPVKVKELQRRGKLLQPSHNP